MPKNKDPFAKENIAGTFSERERQFNSLTNVISALDGELKAKVAKALMDGTKDTTPNYDLINQHSKQYDADKAKVISGIIDSHYDLKSDLSPFRKGLDKTKLDDTSRRLVENLYMGHKDQLKKSVGQSKFYNKMNQAQHDNSEHVRQQLLQSAGAGYNAFQHGDNLIDHLKDKYKVDLEKVDVNRLKAAGSNVLVRVLQGGMSAEDIYNMAPKYKGKKKRDAA
jgi:hypothetical protein